VVSAGKFPQVTGFILKLYEVYMNGGQSLPLIGHGQISGADSRLPGEIPDRRLEILDYERISGFRTIYIVLSALSNATLTQECPEATASPARGAGHPRRGHCLRVASPHDRSVIRQNRVDWQLRSR
jgi:hypothetical protein